MYTLTSQRKFVVLKMYKDYQIYNCITPHECYMNSFEQMTMNNIKQKNYFESFY